MPHLHYNVDFTAEVFVVFENKVLLRKHDKYKIWLSVGGHIEPNEDPSQAAIREVKEEVGLNVELFNKPDYTFLNNNNWKALHTPVMVNRHKINDIHDHVTFVYFATTKNDNLLLCQEEKSDGCQWFTKEELEKLELRPDIKYLAIKAIEECGVNPI